MKRKNLIIIGGILLFVLACIFIGFLILAYGYGGGKAVRPVEKTKELVDLKNEIQKEVESQSVVIATPKNVELNYCSGEITEYINIYIDNDSLKSIISQKKYVISVNERLQKIFPYDKKCYDSVVIQTQYFDAKIDSTINNRFSFPMIK